MKTRFSTKVKRPFSLTASVSAMSRGMVLRSGKPRAGPGRAAKKAKESLKMPRTEKTGAGRRREGACGW
jgi:hypothetical protein